MHYLPHLVSDSRVETAPTLVVNGRSLTSPTHAGGQTVSAGI